MPTNAKPGPIEQAFTDGDYESVLYAVGLKLARKLDTCESSRDCRPLANGLLEAAQKLQVCRAVNSTAPTPLEAILQEAESILHESS